jgi:hypothetical protein
MQHEQHRDSGGHLAEIWRSAQRRRTDDIYLLFTDFVETRQQLKSAEPRPRYSAGRFMSLMWKFLDATRARSRIAS